MSHDALPAGFLYSLRFRISVLLIAIAGLLLPASVRAQASFAAAQNLLASGFQAPTGVAVDGNGNAYVADAYAGTVNEIVAVNGSIPAGATVKTLASGFGEPFGIALDSSGNIYVADLGAGAIKEIVAVDGSIPSSPTVVTLANSASGFSEPFGVAVDSSGNVYFTASGSDPFGNGVVMEIQAVGGSIPASPTIVTLSSSFQEPKGIAVDASGNVYVGNEGDAFISELVAVSGSIPASPTILHLGSGLNEPSSVAVDGSGNVYVADNTLHTAIEMLAVNGSVPASPIILSLGSVSNPWGVAFDNKGNVYASDVNNNVVDEIFPHGSFGSVNAGTPSPTMSTIFNFSGSVTLGSTAVLTTGVSGLDFADAGTGTCTASHTYSAGQSCTVDVKLTPAVAGARHGAVELIDGSGNILATGYVQGVGLGPQVAFGPGLQSTTVTGLTNPIGVAVDASGDIFVADQGNSAVKEILAAGGFTTVNTLASVYTLGGGFNQPASVAVDGAGNVFVADTNNETVKEIVAAGGYTTVNTLASGFTFLWGIAVDGSGNVFVSDVYAGVVQELSASNGYTTLTTLSGYSGNPKGIAVDGSGNIFVADVTSNAIIEIPAAGGYSTSNTVVTGFNNPTAVALDASGNLYVADTNNSQVKEVLAVGGYTTIVNLGSGFDHPQGVAVDARGNLFLTDTGNGNIDELDVADPPSFTFATTNVDSTSIDSPNTVQLENIGNQTLNISALTYPTDFPEATGDGIACTGSTNLIAGHECDLPIDFGPQAGGLLSENVTVTDNALNVSGAIQSIGVSGTGQVQVATHFSVTGPSPVSAGAPFTIVVTALDASNHTVTGYAGTVHFSSSDLAAVLPGNAALTAGAGSFLVTLITPGSQAVAAADSLSPSLNGSGAFLVVPGAATHFGVTAPSSAIGGSTIGIGVTAFDAYGNVATGYTGTVQFTSTDPLATLPSPATLTGGTGTFNASLVTVGTQTITATDSVTATITGTSTGTAIAIPNLVVTTTADHGGQYFDCTPQTTPGTGTDSACALRDALVYAQIFGSANITFDSTVFSAANTAAQNTITLTNDVLFLYSHVSISGPTTGSGAARTNLVTISGGNTYEIFYVGFGVSNSRIESLNITGGFGIYGGAIQNNGALIISDSSIFGNSTVGSPGSYAYAGGIVNGGSGTLTLNNCKVWGNSNVVSGSGSGPSGGGISNSGSLTVNGSSFWGNTAVSTGGQAFGGAIYNTGTMTVSNSTVSGNSATADGMGFGGGIASFSTANIINSTVSNNDADDGAGLYVYYTVVGVTNSIVSGNFAAVNTDVYNEGGTLNDNGGNLIGVSGINLAPLANYGGTTQTMVPLPGSPAICSAATANAPGLTTDQRGFSLDSNCSAGGMDAGAVQSNYALSFSINPPSTVYLNQAISPAPVVQLTESGSLATAAGGTVSMTDLDTLLTGTTSASLGSGLATFSNLVIPSLTGSDALTASMALSPALSLNITAASSTFAVVEPLVQVTVGTSPAGPGFSIDGTPYTSAQTLTWNVGDIHTIATTTPQSLGLGILNAFTSWSDSGAISHQVTASLGTTSYTASFSTTYQLNIAANNGSLGTVTPATGTFYAPGAVVGIGATPTAGNYFTGWTGSADIASASSASTTITMNSPETVTGNFAPIPNFVVTVATDDAGTASNCTAQTAAGTGTDASCSLRDALLKAAATTAGNISFDSTAFATPQTITLTNGTLTVPALTTITGPTSGSGATFANLVTVSGNSATTVFTVNSGVTANMSSLNIVGAVASGGGGISNGGTLTVTGCTLAGNNASNQGAGIFNSGTLTVSNSTLSGNQSAGGQGGGIYNSGTATVTNSTFSANTGFNGGAIYNHGVLNLINDTLSANIAFGAGGGIYSDATLTLANTIVAGNSGPAYADMDGSFTDNGGNQAGIDPSGTSTIAINLAPLANYGGPTQTMLPQPGSPAICAGTSANATGLAGDQRGFAFDSNCASGAVDSGAVQTSYALAFTTEPPANVAVGQAISPAPVVGLTENGAPATAATGSVTMTDSATLLSGTDSESFSSGAATFDNLIVSQATTNDTFTATLALNASLNITATSTQVTATKTTPTITWNTPSAITYGTALTGTQLNATASVAGTFAYTPTAGTVLGVGTQTLSVLLTPTDTTNYTTASANVQLTVNQATPSITWGQPAPIPYGTALSGTQLNATANVPGTFVYAPTSGTVLNPGPQTLSVTFTPTDSTNYSQATANVSITIDQQASLTAPLANSTLPGASVTFTWTAGGGVTAYDLWLGTTGVNSHDVYNSGAISATSVTVNVPANGVKLYARLWSMINGVFQPTDYVFTEAGTPSKAVLTTPAPGGVLSGANVTFQWTAGAGPTQYELTLSRLGVGLSDVYNSGQITATQAAVTGLPTNGVTLYARLWSLINGAWQSTDYTYTEAGAPTLAALTSPTPSSVLSGSSATFQWSTGAGPTEYELWLGTTGIGSSDVYNTNGVTSTSVTVNTLPTNGVTLYARLWSLVSGTWKSVDYIYTEAGTPALAALTSPTPSSLLPGSSATFQWTTGTGPTEYELWLGTTGIGSSNVYNTNGVTTTSVTVNTLPTNGVKLYARLWSLVSGAWKSVDYTYTEAGSPTLAALTSPSPSSILSSSSASFQWTAGAGPTQYELWLGTTGLGSTNVFNSGPLTTVSASVSNIPTNGVKLYARLWSFVSGTWQSVDYTYTESGTPTKAMLTTPTPSSILSGSSVNFNWTTGGGPTAYELWLSGVGVGLSEAYNSGQISGTSTTANSVPTNGVILYARLWSLINGSWQSNDYTYTEAGTPSQGALTTPAPGSQLSGANVTFSWTTGAGPTQYQLWIGSTGVGSSNLSNSGTLTTTSTSVNGLPTNGARIYARLWSRINGSWLSTDYTYTEAGTPTPATLTLPAPSSVLTGSSAAFQWTTGTDATNYQLWLGTTGVNSSNLYNSGSITATSMTVNSLPTNGVNIYIRLWSLINGVWLPVDYVVTESGTAGQAILTSPTPGTQLLGSSVTFTWDPGSGPTAYQLWLGTGVSTSNYYNSGTVTTSSVGVTGLPTDGSTIHARLWSRINGNWLSTDYTYTAQ